MAEWQTDLTWVPLSAAAATAAPPTAKARFPWGLLLCAAYAAGVLFTASFRLGGFFSLEDLADHTSEWVTPVSTTYRGWTVTAG